MKTITYEQLADITIDYIADDETTPATCAALAEATAAVIPKEDTNLFMKIVTDKAVEKLTSAIRDSVA